MERRLQGLGICEAISASEVRVGMVEFRNCGYSYEIVEKTVSKTGKTITLGLKSRNGKDAGTVYHQNYRANQAVVAGFLKSK